MLLTFSSSHTYNIEYSASVLLNCPLALVMVPFQFCKAGDCTWSIPADRECIHSRDGSCSNSCARGSRALGCAKKSALACFSLSRFKSKSENAIPTCTISTPSGNSDRSKGELESSLGSQRQITRAGLTMGASAEYALLADVSRFQNILSVLADTDSVAADEVDEDEAVLVDVTSVKKPRRPIERSVVVEEALCEWCQ